MTRGVGAAIQQHHCLLVLAFSLFTAWAGSLAASADVEGNSGMCNSAIRLQAAAAAPQSERLVLNFFMHDNLLTENPSAITVVPPRVYDNTTLSGQSFFGSVVVFDDSITKDPSPESPELARGRGTYVFDVNNNSTPGIQFVWTAVFNDASGFGGSSLSYQGQDNVLDPVREIAITGGTGSFRLARGYAVITTYSSVAAAFILNITSYVYLES